MAAKLHPALGMSIRGEGKVIFRDVTRYDLHRMCVSVADKYPDLETWCEVLKEKDLKEHQYAEKIIGNVFIGYLWLFWKENEK